MLRRAWAASVVLNLVYGLGLLPEELDPDVVSGVHVSTASGKYKTSGCLGGGFLYYGSPVHVTNPMRQIFNKLRWTGRRAYFRYLNRPGGEEEATTDDVVEVGANGVVVSRGGRESYIPYHRIVEIRLDTGEVLLERRRG
jgi:uncharacterized protein (UPF0248 family)